MAVDALETALDFYFDAGCAVPVLSKPKCGQHKVEFGPALPLRVCS